MRKKRRRPLIQKRRRRPLPPPAKPISSNRASPPGSSWPRVVPLELRNPLLTAWARIVQLFPTADISAKERQGLWWLLRRVFQEAVVNYAASRHGAPVPVDDADRVALSYIVALRPSLKAFRRVVRQETRHQSTYTTTYRSLATFLLPFTKESCRRFDEGSTLDVDAQDQLDPAEAFAQDLSARLRRENKRRPWHQQPFLALVINEVTMDLYHCDVRRRRPPQSGSVRSDRPRPHVVARVLAARVLGRHGRKGHDLSEVQLERLFKLGRSWRVVTWENAEAAAIAERISAPTS